MNFSAAGEKCRPSLWMMPSWRMKLSSVIGIATSDLLRTSGRTAGSGAIEMPVPTSTIRLITSMLSTSAT